MEEKDDFLDEISGKHLNFLIGSGASSGTVPTLWVDSISKSFEELLVSCEYSNEQKNILYYIWFNLWVKKTRILSETEENKETLSRYTTFVKT